MLPTIDEIFKRQYSDVFLYLYQQGVSELRPTIRSEPQDGEMKFWDFIGPTGIQEDLARGANTPDIPTQYTRRKNVLHKANWGEMFYEFDKIQALKDPTNPCIMNAIKAFNRWYDEKILQAIAAIVYTGKEGTTAINSYDVGECRLINGDGTLVTAGSNFSGTTETGLTLAKLGLIKKLMDDASVPPTDRHLVANFDQATYLLGSTKATSTDFSTLNAIQGLANGEMKTYMGFTFHWLPSDRFTANATDTGCYECAAYHKDAVLLGMGKELTTSVDRIPEKTNGVLAQAETFAGAVRLHGPGVVRILLKKEPGVDFTQS